jgi:glycosyltransferase involved in cell wall biosynthesis
VISVIVPAYESRASVGRCLRSLEQQTRRDFEVLFADDGSPDGTLEAARTAVGHDERFRFLQRERRGGAAAARNLALAHARGEWLAFIDADSWAEPDWLERLLRPLEEGSADCVGGPDLVPGDDPLVSRCVGWSVDSPVATGGLRWGSTRMVRYLPGTGNMALARAFYERAGNFDERFHDAGEDKEWLYRVMREKARILYLPDAPVWHHRTTSLATHARKLFCYGVRRVDIWRRWPEAFEWPHLAPAALIGVLCLMPRLWKLGALPLLLDGLMAAWHLKDPRALLVAPLTSALIPLGYGSGILFRALTTRMQPLPERAESSEHGINRHAD